jgi:hypothetical protein
LVSEQNVDVTDMVRVDLEYIPGLLSAVCCSPSHVFVYEAVSLAVHIYTWDGQHRQTVKLQGRDGHDVMDVIYAIQYIPQHRMLLAAIGPKYRATDDSIVTHLLSTKVSPATSLKTGPKYTPLHNEVSATLYMF